MEIFKMGEKSVSNSQNSEDSSDENSILSLIRDQNQLSDEMNKQAQTQIEIIKKSEEMDK